MSKINLQDLDLDNELISKSKQPKPKIKMPTIKASSMKERKRQEIERRKARLSKQHWETV